MKLIKAKQSKAKKLVERKKKSNQTEWKSALYAFLRDA